MKKIGQGCSRSAFLMEDNRVLKVPRYDSDFEDAAHPNMQLLKILIKEFKADKNVNKVLEMMNKGYYLSAPCAGILAEYLVSLKVKGKKSADSLALCEEIIVRKRRNMSEIGIKGIYENGFEKADQVEKIEDVENFPFYVGDLHDGNYIDNKILVDYANIS